MTDTDRTKLKSPAPFRRFDTAKHAFDGIESNAAMGLALAAADIALIVDGDGVIVDLSFHDRSFVDEGAENWVGQRWADIVTIESVDKVAQLLDEAKSNSLTRKREINHLREGLPDLPVRYCAVPLDKSGMVLAIGTDLRSLSVQQQQVIDAQQKIEQEYSKLRQAEARYRVLFRMTSEAVLVVDSVRETIIDANPACVDLLGRSISQIANQKLPTIFDSGSWMALSEMLGAVRSGVKAGEIVVNLGDGQSVSAAASTFTQGGDSHLIVRLSPHLPGSASSGRTRRSARVMQAVESLPEGFVVTDLNGEILLANPAFCDMSGIANVDQAVGQPLDRWIGRTGVDLNVLIANLREHGSVRNFATALRDDYGSSEDVLLSAASVPDGDPPCLGFTIRRAAAVASGRSTSSPMMRSANQLTELVGRVPLKELVRDTTDMIEKMCIEAALDLTRNNRASAAEMLGLSRQSFYMKLHRHGLVDKESSDK
ncbi:MAG: transcriptional regulator PpsR [Anderseniella sp.]